MGKGCYFCGKRWKSSVSDRCGLAFDGGGSVTDVTAHALITFGTSDDARHAPCQPQSPYIHRACKEVVKNAGIAAANGAIEAICSAASVCAACEGSANAKGL